MTQHTTPSAQRAASPAGLILAAACIAGLFVCLLSLGLSCAFSNLASKKQLSENNLTSLRLVMSNLDSIWDNAAMFAGQAAKQLGSAGQKNMAALVEQQRALWPEAVMSLYDQKSERLPLTTEEQTLPSMRSVRAVVQKALVGQSAKDITRTGAHVSLSVSVPLHSGNARALVVTVPLDGKILFLLKERALAHVALLPVDDSGKSDAETAAQAANTFAPAGGSAERIWQELSAQPPRVQSGAPSVLTLRDGSQIGALLLEDVLGVPAGLLITHSEVAAPKTSLMQNLTAALIAGLAAALVCGLGLRFYAGRMGNAFAGAVVAISEQGRDSGENDRDDWPPALQEALSKIAALMREYRKRVRTAEVELDAAGRRLNQGTTLSRSSLEDEDYLRLFENAPVGVFQAEGAGAFVRVNQAFALMLGYDTPVMLLTENVSFTDLCLYGDEIRNPLNMLMEQGGGRQIISLRKRDGKIGDYILICVPITSASGDRSSLAEGFLLDRDLEDQLVRAERERELADKQRNSLALLLAATSLQTQSSLALPRQGQEPPKTSLPPALAESEPGQEEASRGAVPERRKSVLAIRDIMSDIYQIAMTEATTAQPVEVPIDLGRFLRRLCRQALPAMQARGISFFCELAEDLPSRFNGPAPMLRHTLQRALLCMSSPVKSGWACLSVRRDPNAPRSPGLSRVLFSISWSAYRRDDENRSFFPSENSLLQPGKGEFVRIVDVQNPAVEDDALPEAKVLDFADEQDIIRYLAQRMHGDLLEGALSSGFRSMQIIVPLSHAGDLEEQAEVSPTPLAGMANPEDPALAALNVENEVYTDRGVSGVTHEENAPLNILVDDASGHDFEVQSRLSGPGLNILLVDDSLNNRLLFSLYLKDTQHSITEAHDGQEGVEAFKRGSFDVIFMDMEMPLMDGYQATRIIRALEADSGASLTPIVAMTSYALPEFRRQCMLSGCTDFLGKPFSKIALYSILDAFSQLKDGEQSGDETV